MILNQIREYQLISILGLSDSQEQISIASTYWEFQPIPIVELSGFIGTSWMRILQLWNLTIDKYSIENEFHYTISDRFNGKWYLYCVLQNQT